MTLPGIQKVLILPDIHGQYRDAGALAVARDFAADFKPHLTIQLGDLIDAECAATFAYVPKPLDQLDEYLAMRELLDQFKVQVLLEGNHEERFRRPDNMRFDLWRMLSPQYWFELEKRKIKWVPYSNSKHDLFRIGHLTFLHGFSCGQYAVADEARAFGCVVHGHTHRIAQFQPRHAYESTTGFNVGCLCKLDLAYQRTGKPRGWAQGFAFAYIFASGGFSLYQVRLIGSRFVIEGKEYFRGGRKK